METKTVKKIGRFKLPETVTIRYEVDSHYRTICARCDDLNLVGCAYSKAWATRRLEYELRDAIVHYARRDPANLDEKASALRLKLLKIDEMYRGGSSMTEGGE